MKAAAIRRWLLLNPKPAVVRYTPPDGVPQEVKVHGPLTRMAQTLEALAPELMEALGPTGDVLRAVRPNDEPTRTEQAQLPAVLSDDPQAAMFMMFARELARAYEYSTEIAFVKIVELVERMNDRSDSIEQRLERAESKARRVLEERIDDLYDRAEEDAERYAAEHANAEGDPQKAMVQAFMQGALSGGGMFGKKPPPAPNGAGANGKA